MNKFTCIASAAIALTLSFGIAHAAPKNLKEFTTAFCKAQTASAVEEKIFMVPASMFTTDKQPIKCPNGNEYSVVKMADNEDPGHYAFEVDPGKTASSANSYDCDSKADDGMKFIGLNCFPAAKEVAVHKKSAS